MAKLTGLNAESKHVDVGKVQKLLATAEKTRVLHDVRRFLSHCRDQVAGNVNNHCPR